MGFLQKIMLVWTKVSLTQRVLLIAIALTAVAGVGLIVHWARRPDMQFLYGGLGAEEAAQIRDHLDAKDIPLAIEAGGSVIKVPAKYINEARLSISGAGLLSNQNRGYKILENQPIGISPAAQDVNIKRALQEELAFTIETINGIVSARVHISDEENRLFRSTENETSASVTLAVKPGYRLTPGNVVAIRNLVAASVTGLVPDNVTVVDTQGTLLSNTNDELFGGQAGTLQDYKERVERSLERKAEAMLEATLGPNRAKVTVSVVIDTNNLTVRSTKHTQGSTTKEEIDEITETKPVTAADGQPGEPEELTDSKTITTWEPDVEVSEHSETPGGVISRTVAVIVDLRPPDANEAGGAPVTPLMSIADVNNLVTQALGLGPADKLTVIDAVIYRPEAERQDDPAVTWRWYLALAERASTGVLALCALLVLMILQRARKKATAAAAGQAQLAGAETAGLLPGEPAEEGVQKGRVMRKKIAATLKNDPDQVRQLFAAWLQEG